MCITIKYVQFKHGAICVHCAPAQLSEGRETASAAAIHTQLLPPLGLSMAPCASS